MAILQTTTGFFSRGRVALELKPNLPTQRDLVDTYLVRLWVHDQLIYEQTQSVRNWQMRHFYVELIAKAFCCVQEFIGREIYCTYKGVDSNESQSTYLSSAYAELDTTWLIIYLSAIRNKRKGDFVHANIFVRKARTIVGDREAEYSTGKWGEWDDMIGASILCRPEDAVAFGTQLMSEIKDAEKMRIELGIPGYDAPSFSEAAD
jgi:hypothetical protein